MTGPHTVSLVRRLFVSLVEGLAVGVAVTLGRYWLLDDTFTGSWQGGARFAVVWFALRFAFYTYQARQHSRSANRHG